MRDAGHVASELPPATSPSTLYQHERPRHAELDHALFANPLKPILASTALWIAFDPRSVEPSRRPPPRISQGETCTLSGFSEIMAV